MLWTGVVCVLLLAGSSSAVRELEGNAGKDIELHVYGILQTIASCHLTTPDEGTLDFYPDQASTNDRYTLRPIDTSDIIRQACVIAVSNLKESDSGTWEIAYKSTNGQTASELYRLTVIGAEKAEADDVTWLNPIDFPTRTGQNIDISLNLLANQENCYVRKPGGVDVKFSEANINGVATQSRSDFVSCRITIGPIDESLIGDWALCGKHTNNGKELERCQLVRITWNNNGRPANTWPTTTQSKFNHVVNFGGTLAPVVLGTGSLITCHVITPNGEDLVIDQDSNFPNLNLVPADSSTCSVAIGPIDASLLGDWTIYGKFRSEVQGLNEVRLPMNLFLYDESNPYEQAYNVTVIEPARRAINLGTTLNVEVTSTGQVDSCQFKTPSGETYNLDNHLNYDGASFVDIGEGPVCRLAIGPTTAQLLGDWEVIGKFSNNGRFTELQQTFHVMKEDPLNPILEDRKIEYLSEQIVNAEIGSPHRVAILWTSFVSGESCHIRTPAGLQYAIMDGFSLEGVRVIDEPTVECGVVLTVLSEEAIGTWTLIARATRHSEAIERRLPFTINVEEIVDAIPNEVTIVEGNDLYVRLSKPTDQKDTCKLVGPHEAVSPHIVDPMQVDSCGYIVENITTTDSGIWVIVYGSRTTYRAPIVVDVTVDSGNTENESFMTTLDLVRDRAVEKTVGPEDAVYCRLEDPQGVTVFDGFGRCNLALDRVSLEHQGVWKMVIGSAGRVVAQEHQLYVNVRESEGKPLVTTHVEKQRPVVIVSCAVATEAEVHACKFRDPHGRVLLASSGVAEDRYTFHGTETSYQSDVRTHECGLTITNPLVSDLGLWRCAIETSEDTYYGFMDVLCPWSLQDPAVAATVQQEPILSVERALVSGVEAQPITMACSVEAAIRYCYFRAQNGTTFAVTPGMSSSSMEYVGNGFEAGECGVRFHGMRASDSGRWSCHVGLVRDHEEQRDQFQLTVHERMRVNHYYSHGSNMLVEGVVHEGRALDYCRFVRIDGFGFTNENVPSTYTLSGILGNGECQITIRNPTILDMHPWTVVARIRGHDDEISRDTMEAILIVAPPSPAPEDGITIVQTRSGLTIFFYFFLSVLLAAIVLGIWLGPKKNREWTYNRASAFRRSLQSSLRKQPMPPPSGSVDQRV